MTPNLGRALALTTLAMIAFAANSVIARLALDGGHIGPGKFTGIRLVSGALILGLIMAARTGGISASMRQSNWVSALSLFSYAAFFSYAYLSLTAGTGALILFAAVQITMVGSGLISGEKLSPRQSLGTVSALAGLVYWLGPSVEAPPILGALMMIISGISWGVYSLRGRGAEDPAQQTAGNFLRAGLLCLLLIPLVFVLKTEQSLSQTGIALALLSGTVTSGLGYVIWYMALKHLSAIKAGLAQLSVPVIAAIGGIIFISEPLTLRFAITAFVILLGVGLATLTPRQE